MARASRSCNASPARVVIFNCHSARRLGCCREISRRSSRDILSTGSVPTGALFAICVRHDQSFQIQFPERGAGFMSIKARPFLGVCVPFCPRAAWLCFCASAVFPWSASSRRLPRASPVGGALWGTCRRSPGRPPNPPANPRLPPRLPCPRAFSCPPLFSCCPPFCAVPPCVCLCGAKS